MPCAFRSGARWSEAMLYQRDPIGQAIVACVRAWLTTATTRLALLLALSLKWWVRDLGEYAGCR